MKNNLGEEYLGFIISRKIHYRVPAFLELDKVACFFLKIFLLSKIYVPPLVLCSISSSLAPALYFTLFNPIVSRLLLFFNVFWKAPFLPIVVILVKLKKYQEISVFSKLTVYSKKSLGFEKLVFYYFTPLCVTQLF